MSSLSLVTFTLSLNKLIIFLCLHVAVLRAAEPPSAVEKTVQSLGPNTTRQDLAVLRSDPVKSVHLLVNQLTTISERRISTSNQEKHPKEMRVIWSIRALRYITSLDFKARTKHSFKGQEEEDRKKFLRVTDDRETSFFGVWMSRDTIYIAPKDAQNEIIQKWKSWVDAEAARHHYDEPPHVDNWYF